MKFNRPGYYQLQPGKAASKFLFGVSFFLALTGVAQAETIGEAAEEIGRGIIGEGPIIGDLILTAGDLAAAGIYNHFASQAPDFEDIAGPTAREHLASSSSGAVGSSDPNDITGPAGVGPQHYVTGDQTFDYTIHFENLATATAPAQEVVITQQLDHDLDWTTFELGDFGFGNLRVDVPAGRNFYQTRLDLRATLGLFVDCEGGINLQTGQVTWKFTSIDPATGDLTGDPLAGFLPPNRNGPEGEGFVTYAVRPKADLPTGTEIRGVALIRFDTNPVIATNQVDPQDPTKGTDPAKEALVTLDAAGPAAGVRPLPAVTSTTRFPVTWSGADDAAGSGIAAYDVFVSDNGGPFTPFRLGTTETSATFTGAFGHTYRFFSVATDRVGHQEVQALDTAEATTRLVKPEPLTAFVTALYHTVLGRAPDAKGLATWVGQLRKGTSRTAVARAFWESAEHRGQQVNQYYVTFLGRNADAAGRQRWVAAFQRGASETEIIISFLSSEGYRKRHPTAVRYVDAVFTQVLDRAANPADRARWVPVTARPGGRAVTARGLTTSREGYLNVLDHLYAELLGRPADAAGRKTWLSRLQKGQRTVTQVAEAFLASNEFFARRT